jgi:diaminopimelate epimerase
MKLKFTKMHGAGNDFIVIDAINQQVDLGPEQWRRLADRRFGIGADQILVVEAPTEEGCDFRYRIFNNDGGEVEQCGNGSRAFVRFVSDKGLTDKRSIRVQTMAGIITPRLEDDGSVTVDMGAPVLEPAQVPFDSQGLEGVAAGPRYLWPLTVRARGAREQTVLVSTVSMGNPHAVQVVDDVDTAPVRNRPADRTPPALPEAGQRRLPAGAGPPSRQAARVRARRRRNPGLRHRRLRGGRGRHPARPAGLAGAVEARGGRLSIAWAGEGQPVYLSGPAETVFEGEITL